MILKRLAGIALLAAAGAAFAAAEEPAYTSSATSLKSEPSRSAETLAELPQKTVLVQLARKGAWVQVRHGQQTGWVRLLVVRPGAPGAERRGESGLRKLFNVARSGSSGAVATTGVRGLDKEQIENATPNPTELAKLDGYVASEADARKFATEKKAGLSAATVPYVAADGSAAKE
ncbi:MAG: hypothetical protein ACT4QA_23015 [Panacagrimonas sp.]